MKFSIHFLFVLFSLPVFAQQSPYLIIGTYTGGKSDGIQVYSFDTISGSAEYVSKIKTSNPSYLAISPDQHFVYAVNEDADSLNKGGRVTTFAFDPGTGTLKQVNQQSSNGNHPCYVSVDKKGKWVIVGNYSSGNLSVLPIQADGSLGFASQIINHKGSGPNKQRQEKPHVHAVVLSADNRFLFVPDLGIDKVMIYAFNDQNGSLKKASPPYEKVKPGTGPRHFDFHPSGKFAYLMEELSGAVIVFKYDGTGKLKTVQTVSALPAGFNGAAGSADIHVSPDGKFLYCSNRGESNTIAIFKIDEESGKLSLAGHQSTLGKTPRNFNFDPSGNFLLVANQNSDNVVVFKRDPHTGLLTDTGKRIEVGNPVCIKWIAK